ncbi:platelet endothelial cell adhesion molecule isoform X2 [Brachyhypopomus gauderio]|uniref:platelet endothelial cell adhesion molecule isoform X2 n=1 Tax=Brachyhypopomus gauderio TaxID=698409 RepID=UPI004042AD17
MEHQALWFTLLLSGISTICQAAEAPSEFTIDRVKLTFLPGATVESGTNLTLLCKAKISYSSSQPIHTFKLLLDGKVIYSKNTSDASLEVNLAPARVSNSGFYRCDVHIRQKEMSSETRRLTVKGLQTPTLTAHPSTVYEGGEVTATCSAPQEVGSLIFHFYVDSTYITAVQASSGSSATAKMKVLELGNVHLYCNYQIILSHTSAMSSNSSVVEVSIKELGITPSIRIWPHANVVEGDRISISCNVSRYNHSDLEIFLTKDKLLHKDHVSFTQSFEVKVDDSGEYVCKAEKGPVQKTTSARLNVAPLFSKPVLSITPPGVFEGQNFYLSCKSSINTQRKPNVKYSLYNDQRLVKLGHTLSGRASQATNGRYTCVAEALSISKTSTQLTVTVKVPVSSPVIRAVGRLVLGRPFQLVCESELGTLPITLTLLRNNSRVAEVNVTGPLRRALFNVSSIPSRRDVQSFVCQARNQGLETILLSNKLDTPVIETVSKPVLTLDTKGYTVTEGMNLTLRCSVQQGSAPVSFAFYRDGSASPFFNTTSNRTQGTHTIESVRRDHGGGYYCQASNEASETKRSNSVAFGVNLAGWKKAAIAALCFLLLVVIVVILILFLKKARAPRHTKRAKELSVMSARHKSGDPMRVSLTLDFEDNNAANATPSVVGRSVWCEDVSNSGSDNQSREEEEECEKIQYTEPPAPQEVKAETDPEPDTVTAEVQVQDGHHDNMDLPQNSDLEYVHLNHSEQEPE